MGYGHLTRIGDYLTKDPITFREKISISLTLCTPPQKLSPRLREINRVKKNGFISVEILFQNALHECICHHIVHCSFKSSKI